MTVLKAKKIHGKKYYYLITTIRVAGKIQKFYRYVGPKLPKKESPEYKRLLLDFSKEIKSKMNTGLIFLYPENLAKLDELRDDFNKKKAKISPALVERFKRDFMTTFTFNSNAIEGNKMSQREVTRFLTEGVMPRGQNIRDVYETRNHAEGIKFIESYKNEFNEKFLLKINKMILKDVWDDAGGRYRKLGEEVRIGNDTGWPSYSLKKKMKEFFQWFRLAKKTMHPFELAVMTHFKLVEIHPFCDGNGRTARLVMNFILKKNNYPYLIILNKKRDQYYRVIRNARKGNYYPLLKFAFRTMISNPILNTLLGKNLTPQKRKNN